MRGCACIIPGTIVQLVNQEGLEQGARVPIELTSRADNPRACLASCVLAPLVAQSKLKRPSFSHNYKKNCTNTQQNRRGHYRPSRFLTCNRPSSWSKGVVDCDVYGDEGRLVSLLYAVFYIRVETNLPSSKNLSLPSRHSPPGLHLSSLAFAPLFSPSSTFLLLTHRAYNVLLTTTSPKHMRISQGNHSLWAPSRNLLGL